MSDFENILLRLKERLGMQTDKEVAEQLGLGSKAFMARKARGAFPDDKLYALAMQKPELNLDVNYILNGLNPLAQLDKAVQQSDYEVSALKLEDGRWPRLVSALCFAVKRGDSNDANNIIKQLQNTRPHSEANTPPVAHLKDSNFIMVPRYDVRASAGTGAVIHSETIVDHLAFKQDWVTQMGLSKKDLALIEVQGDSMEPAIMHNDLILIDLRESKLSANGVFVLQHMGNLLVKRIQVKLDGTVVIKSDNPNYEAEVLSASEAESLVVIGRVAWFGRQL